MLPMFTEERDADVVKKIRLICRKLARGKDFSQICDEVEDLEENVKPIYDIAITFAPDYSPEKVMEKMGITPIEEE